MRLNSNIGCVTNNFQYTDYVWAAESAKMSTLQNQCTLKFNMTKMYNQRSLQFNQTFNILANLSKCLTTKS